MSWILGFDVWRLSFSELRKSIICLRGSMIHENGHSVAREHLLLLVRIHIYRVLMLSKDWLIAETFPSIWRIGSVTKLEPKSQGEHFHVNQIFARPRGNVRTSLLSNRYLFVFIGHHRCGVFNLLFIHSFNESILSSRFPITQLIASAF